MPNDNHNERVTISEPVAGKRRGISIIWVIPLVAALIGVWLTIKTVSEEGPYVTVTFRSAEGLEAGKTKVKYRDVEVGLVDNIALADDRTHVDVGIKMTKSAEPYVTESARFWIVRARLDATGVSGLSTLLSGAYMEVEPGSTKDKKRSHFVGLETPPVVSTDVPGRRFVLLTDKLGSLSGHSPIYFLGIKVGEILGYELAEDRAKIRVYAFVRTPYDKYVLDNSNFWSVSGIEVVAGTDGIKVRMESFQSLLSGGVSFEANPDLPNDQPAAENREFPLYANHDAVREAAIVEENPFMLHFNDSVRGLGPGASVEFRGIRVGSVKSIRPEIDLERHTIRIAVVIAIEPQRLRPTAEVVGSAETQPKYAFFSSLVAQGLRAQLVSGSLITGQQIVSLDFHPDDPPKKLDTSGKIPEIPTVGSPLNRLVDSVGAFLEKLNKLPLDLLVGDIRTTIQTLDGTLVETKGLVQSTRGEMTPMLAKFQEAAAAARDALLQAQTTLSSVDGMVGDNSEIRESLATTLRELAGAARSIRDLGDYLERHPEALVKGKVEQR